MQKYFPNAYLNELFQRHGKDHLFFFELESQNHRISWVTSDPQRSLSSTPGFAQDHPKNQTICLRVLSKHFLDFSRLGATASLGILFQCPNSLLVKDHLLISSLYCPCHRYKPFPWVLSMVTRKKRLVLTLLLPLERKLETVMMSPLSLLFYRMDKPSHFRHSSYVFHSRPFTMIVVHLHNFFTAKF